MSKLGNILDTAHTVPAILDTAHTVPAIIAHTVPAIMDPAHTVPAIMDPAHTVLAHTVLAHTVPAHTVLAHTVPAHMHPAWDLAMATLDTAPAIMVLLQCMATIILCLERKCSNSSLVSQYFAIMLNCKRGLVF